MLMSVDSLAQFADSLSSCFRPERVRAGGRPPIRRDLPGGPILAILLHARVGLPLASLFSFSSMRQASYGHYSLPTAHSLLHRASRSTSLIGSSQCPSVLSKRGFSSFLLASWSVVSSLLFVDLTHES